MRTAGNDSLVVGKGAMADGDGSVAWGTGARVEGDGSLAVGPGAKVLGNGAVAIGPGAVAVGHGQVVFADGFEFDREDFLESAALLREAFIALNRENARLRTRLLELGDTTFEAVGSNIVLGDVG